MKRLAAWVLALVMVLSLCPVTAWAEAGEEEVRQTAATSYDGELGYTDEEAFAAYFQRELDASLGYETPSFYRTSALEAGTYEKAIYDALKAALIPIAEGTNDSTVIDLSTVDGAWTAEDLGVDALVVGGAITAEAGAAIGKRMSVVYSCLLADCPLELYWHDKAINGAFSYGFSGYASALSVTTVSFCVATDYAVNGAAGTTVVDTDKTGVIETTIENAEAIVAANAAKSDAEKLEAYKDAICQLVSYNDAAAEASGTEDGINPWQMIWVFDGDATTEVVCEGYSKAFQYLCDLSDFTGDIQCHTVSGTMSGGTGAGGHMWNVVTMDDGNHYLVDVTNCDTGTVGAPDKLFLAHATTSSTNHQVHTFADTGMTFTYDSSMCDLFCDGYLAISLTAYEADSGTGGEENDEAEARWGKTPSNGGMPASWEEGTLADAVDYANGLASGSAYIQLLTDVDTTAPLVFADGKTAILDLNGKTIDRGLSGAAASESGNVITVEGMLDLCDSSSDDVTKQGTITGGNFASYSGGGGVYVAYSGNFTMGGGNITGNATACLPSGEYYYGGSGGGVYVEGGGSFTLDGGAISGNVAEDRGGGVCAYDESNVSMTGGSISGNRAGYFGGGVSGCSIEFKMTGGSISGNTLDDEWNGYGGGVFLEGTGTMSMSGGTIFENESAYGGGVCAFGGMTMTGGIIRENTASQYGGGVSSEGPFIMSGGSVVDNTAGRYGGGVDVCMAVLFDEETGEEILDEETGDVVFVPNYIGFSGSPVISDNTVEGQASNLYLYEENVITVEGALGEGAYIGVSVATEPTEGNPVTIAKGTEEYAITKADSTRFSSDADYVVVASGDNLKLSVNAQSEARWGVAGSNGAAPDEWTAGDLTDAVDYANLLDSGTAYIQLLKNVATTESLAFYNDTPTILDLNGNTIDRGLTEAVESGEVITVFGDLTVCDSSSDDVTKQGTITGGYTAPPVDNVGGGGGGVIVFGSFTLSGGKITENIGTTGGVWVIVGDFTMTGGAICDNTGSDMGGGVYVNNDCTFTMSGGSINGNEAEAVKVDDIYYGGLGGGIWNNGTVTMTGGTIQDNKAGVFGGGIIGSDGTIVVSGSPVIKENTSCFDGTERPDNINLNTGETIIVSDSLSTLASIGVSVSDIPNAVNTVPVAEGTEAYTLREADAEVFYSDAGYTAMLADNTVVLTETSVVAELIGVDTVARGEEVTLTLRVTGANISGLEGTISYDEDILELVSVEGLLYGWEMEENGERWYTYHDEETISGTQDVLQMTLRVKGSSDAGTFVNFTDINATVGERNVSAEETKWEADVLYSMLLTPNGNLNVYEEATLDIQLQGNLDIEEIKFEEEQFSELFTIVETEQSGVYRVMLNMGEKPEGLTWADWCRELVGTYSSELLVKYGEGESDWSVVDGELTIKLTAAAPRVKATAVKLNSFYTAASQSVETLFTLPSEEMVITDIVSADDLSGDWIEYDEETRALRLVTDEYGRNLVSAGSTRLNFEVWLEGYRAPAEVVVSVSAAYTVPKLKLEKSNVSLMSKYQQPVALQLLSGNSAVDFADIGVVGVHVVDVVNDEWCSVAYDEDFGSTGAFTLNTDATPVSGKLMLAIEIDGAADVVEVPLTVKVIAPALKAAPAKVTLNTAKIGASATVALSGNGVTAEWFAEENVTISVIPPRGVEEPKLEVENNYDGTFTIRAGDGLEDGSYKVNIEVVGTAKPVTVTVTAKATLPKLKAAAVKLNSFYTAASQSVAELFTVPVGETITAIGMTENTGEGWLAYDAVSGALCLVTDDDGANLASKGSAKVTFAVSLEGYSEPVEVVVSVSAAYTAPKLKLKASSVSLMSKYQQPVALQLLSGDSAVDFADIGVVGVYVVNDEWCSVAYDEDFGSTGVFTLNTDATPVSGKLQLAVKIDGAAGVVLLPLTVKVLAPALKAAPAKVTLNTAMDVAEATVELSGNGVTAEWFAAENVHITVTPEDTEKLIVVNNEDGTFTIRAGEGLAEGAYKVNIAVDGVAKPVTIAVTVKATLPVLKIDLKALSLDVENGVAMVTVTGTEGFSGAYEVEVPAGIAYECIGNTFKVWIEDAELLGSRGGKFSVKYVLDNGMETKPIAVTVKPVSNIAASASAKGNMDVTRPESTSTNFSFKYTGWYPGAYEAVSSPTLAWVVVAMNGRELVGEQSGVIAGGTVCGTNKNDAEGSWFKNISADPYGVTLQLDTAEGSAWANGEVNPKYTYMVQFALHFGGDSVPVALGKPVKMTVKQGSTRFAADTKTVTVAKETDAESAMFLISGTDKDKENVVPIAKVAVAATKNPPAFAVVESGDGYAVKVVDPTLARTGSVKLNIWLEGNYTDGCEEIWETGAEGYRKPNATVSLKVTVQ